MSRRRILFGAAIASSLALASLTSSASATPYQVLHSFSASTGGASGDLVVIGGKIYGTGGGAQVFSMNTDGSAFANIHTFGGSGDASIPAAGLSRNGSTLYGAAYGGPGATNGGIVYSLDTSNNNYQVIRTLSSFSGSYSNAVPLRNPLTAPVIANSTLFGNASDGGYPFGFSGYGGVYRMNLDGSSPQALYGFDGRSDGAHPIYPLTVSADGQKVFGVTAGDVEPDNGPGRYGAMFMMNAAGTDYFDLHGFQGGTDGSIPTRLVEVGNKLIGTTPSGGTGFNGTMFSFDLDTFEFNTLFEFPADASGPQSLTLAGTKLFGMTYQGGESGMGTVFSINLDGTGFEVLHDFAGGPNDGAFPNFVGGLTIVGSNVYGATQIGGTNDGGTIFKLTVSGLPEPSSIVLAVACFGAFALAAWRKRSRSR